MRKETKLMAQDTTLKKSYRARAGPVLRNQSMVIYVILEAMFYFLKLA